MRNKKTNTKNNSIHFLTRFLSQIFLFFALSAVFLAISHAATAASISYDIDVNLTVPSPPIISISYIFNCSPKEVRVGEHIYCRVYSVDNLGSPNIGDPIKIISSRNKNITLDTIDPVFRSTDSNGNADFSITSNTAGEGVLHAILVKDSSFIGNPITFRFLSAATTTSPIPIVLSSDISTDKTKLVIGKDKATILVKIFDQNKKPLSSIPVTLLYDAQYGESDQRVGLTNDQGIATFIYTPKKKGRAEIGAKTDLFTLDKKLFLEISEGTPLDRAQASVIAQEIASVLAPIVTTATAFSLISLIASIISSTPATLHALMYIISLIIEALGFKRKKKNSGRVYNSTTGKGVDLALVRLYDQQTMKLVGTMVTDLVGRYNFKLEPGTYAISVIKEGFTYPTQIFAKYGIAKVDKTATKIFSHYIGQPINITEKDSFLNIDIPIDPLIKETSTLFKIKIWTEDFLHVIASNLSFIFIPSLIFGSLASSFVAIILSGKRNLIIAIIYLLFTLIYVLIRMTRSKQFGIVIDSEGVPVSGAMVSIFEKNYSILKESQITDRFGRFLIFAEAGEYLLKTQKGGYEFSPENLESTIGKIKRKDKYRGEIITIKKPGYVKFSIIGKKI